MKPTPVRESLSCGEASEQPYHDTSSDRGLFFSADPSVAHLTLEACQALEAEYLQKSVKSPSVSDTRVLNFPVYTNAETVSSDGSAVLADGLLEALAVADITKNSVPVDRYTVALKSGKSPSDAAFEAVDAYAEYAANRAEADALRQWRNDPQARPLPCHRPVIIQGHCKAHNVEHIMLVRCKRRTCPQCGAWIARTRAKEIESGIKTFQNAGHRVAHFVGTFAEDVTAEALNRTVFLFLRRVRRYLKAKVRRRVEYVRVDEKTRAGRYHTHILLAPWSYIPQAILSQWWQQYGGGRVVYIKVVGDTATDMSSYLTKLDGQEVRTPSQANLIAEYLGGCSKDDLSFSQQSKGYEVIVEPGKRSIAFSRHWPRLEAFKVTPSSPRKGKIQWSIVRGIETEGILDHALPNGRLIPVYESVSVTEYYWRFDPLAKVPPSECHCFEFVGSDFCSFSPSEAEACEIDEAKPPP